MNPLLTEETFVLFAAKTYDNPSCQSMADFYEDLDSFLYLKRLLLKQLRHKKSNNQLIINHLIAIKNMFGRHALQMLFFKIPRECWSILKTFLVFLNYMPDNYKINDHIDETTIPLDLDIIHDLRKI